MQKKLFMLLIFLSMNINSADLIKMNRVEQFNYLIDKFKQIKNEKLKNDIYELFKNAASGNLKEYDNQLQKLNKDSEEIKPFIEFLKSKESKLEEFDEACEALLHNSKDVEQLSKDINICDEEIFSPRYKVVSWLANQMKYDLIQNFLHKHKCDD